MMNNADGLTCYAESVDFSGRFFEQHRIVLSTHLSNSVILLFALFNNFKMMWSKKINMTLVLVNLLFSIACF